MFADLALLVLELYIREKQTRGVCVYVHERFLAKFSLFEAHAVLRLEHPGVILRPEESIVSVFRGSEGVVETTAVPVVEPGLSFCRDPRPSVWKSSGNQNISQFLCLIFSKK